MRNQDIVDILYQIADILEIVEESKWIYLAYRKAARTIEGLSDNVAEVLGRSEKLPGIGKAIETKLKELVTTGELKYFEELKNSIPRIVIEMTRIEGIGPKTAKLIHDKLKIQSLKDLEKVTRSHRIQRIKGIGPKMEKTILEGLVDLKKPKRHLLGVMLPIATMIYERLKGLKEVTQVSLGGSIRRRRETIRDIDILVTSKKPERVMQFFTTMDLVKKVVLKGPTKSTINVIRGGVQVDLRVVEDESYGAALQYFTGSKEHNVVLRGIAVQRGYKLNEYGLFLKDTDEKVAGKTEEEVYRALGMVLVPPELREDRGEIQVAQSDSLPNLVDYTDIKGDLHSHSSSSDGKNSIEEMVDAAKNQGYEYFSITDHVGSLKVVKAVDDKTFGKQISQIRELDKQEEIRIFTGAEVNIKLDGSLDLSEDLLSQLDIVIGSVHSKLRMPRQEMTERVITALSNEYLTILGHPTGRLLNKRRSSDLDLLKIIEVAKDQGKILEINAYPPRLDLNDVNCRTANQHGVLLTIGTDSHSVSNLKNMELGVAVARRGWLEKQAILNTQPLREIMKTLQIK